MASRTVLLHGSALVLLLTVNFTASAQQPPPTPAAPALTLAQLTCMSRCELEALYTSAAPASVLDGYYCGRAIRCSGKRLDGPMSKATGVVWKGKFFCAGDCTIVNRWLCGLQAIQANVYAGESWFDGKPSLIMDYRGSSKIWSDVRDELRQVGPCLYLGMMYREKGCEPKFAMFFALEAPAH